MIPAGLCLNPLLLWSKPQILDKTADSLISSLTLSTTSLSVHKHELLSTFGIFCCSFMQVLIIFLEEFERKYYDILSLGWHSYVSCLVLPILNVHF